MILILKNEIYLHFFMHSKREVLAASTSATRSSLLNDLRFNNSTSVPKMGKL